VKGRIVGGARGPVDAISSLKFAVLGLVDDTMIAGGGDGDIDKRCFGTGGVEVGKQHSVRIQMISFSLLIEHFLQESIAS
jgi:hypothetical protein